MHPLYRYEETETQRTGTKSFAVLAWWFSPKPHSVRVGVGGQGAVGMVESRWILDSV